MTWPAELEWDEDGTPRSARYGDVYFSREGGLAESRAVFLAGCGLPAAWAGRRRFTIGELGLGTGLNLAAALQLWRQAGPPGARLSLFSIEAHPVTAAEAGRALGAWPELADAAAALTARWPGRARGFHRIELTAFNACLDVAVMDAEAALAAWSGHADAWFLDGFAPAKNPRMWSPQVLRLVAERSASGARAATYTVAGAVRRGLAEAGFAVSRAPGYGRKRERLEAVRPGAAAEPGATRASGPSVAIVGAGIAGASLARAFAAEGIAASVFDASGAGAGASGNAAALVTPRLDAGLGDIAGLFAAAWRRAVSLYEDQPQAVIARGALQLERTPRDARRFAAIAACDLFEPGALTLLSADEVTVRLGEPAPGALLIDGGLVVEPRALLGAWLGDGVRHARVAAIEPVGGGWRLLDEGGGLLAEAEVVVLAAGDANRILAPGLPLSGVRGQASLAAGVSPPAAAFGGYVIPTRDGALFGATHDRGQDTSELRDEDQARNLATVAATLPSLAMRLGAAIGGARAGVRSTTPDHLPLAGLVPGAAARLFVLGGLGSRGYALAPLLAEHVAALAIGAPSPLAAAQAALVAPARFAERARKRVRLGDDGPGV
jgi:tRNA 5-methylaminomethyl-2-thiouridine biosynthesis bifunctional protein